MACFFVTGCFPLANGNSVSINSSGRRNAITHHVYDATVRGVSGNGTTAAMIRQYARTNEPIYQDQSVALVFDKVYVPPSQAMLIEVLNFSAFPRNPSSVEYDIGLPDILPVFVVLGHVHAGAVQVLSDGGRVFHMSTVAYIGAMENVAAGDRVTNISILMPNTPRWQHSPAPLAGSAAQIVANFYGYHSNGYPLFQVLEMTYNTGACAPLVPSPATTSTTPAAPAPARKSIPQGMMLQAVTTAFPVTTPAHITQETLSGWPATVNATPARVCQVPTVVQHQNATAEPSITTTAGYPLPQVTPVSDRSYCSLQEKKGLAQTAPATPFPKRTMCKGKGVSVPLEVEEDKEPPLELFETDDL